MVSSFARKDVDAPTAAQALPPAAYSVMGDDFDRNVWCVLGLPVDAIGLAGAATAIETAVASGRRLNLATPNVNWLVRALKDPAARRQCLNADLSIVDGAPLAAAARLLGAPLKGRVAGSDLFEALRKRPSSSVRRLRVFFFGGADGAGEAAVAALAGENGGLEPAGFLNPGFGDVEAMSGEAVIGRINAAAPDFIVVSLGAAKGQAWIERNKDRLSAPVISPLGAVVNFVAGTVARAPKWVSDVGLEWAWRIYEEPALWRRYAGDGVVFARLFATRLAPLLLRARRGRENAPALAEIESRPAGLLVRISGDLCAPGLAEMRRAFRRAAAGSGDVTLDFSGAGRIDAAFLGLLLMLEKHVSGRRGAIRIVGLSRAGQALFRANAIDYPAASRPGPETAAPAPARHAV